MCRLPYLLSVLLATFFYPTFTESNKMLNSTGIQRTVTSDLLLELGFYSLSHGVKLRMYDPLTIMVTVRDKYPVEDDIKNRINTVIQNLYGS